MPDPLKKRSRDRGSHWLPLPFVVAVVLGFAITSFKAPHLPFAPDPIDLKLYASKKTFMRPLNYGVENGRHLATQRAFREGQVRIRSIALIHEKLYASNDLRRIGCTDYTRLLMADLFQAYDINQDAICLQLNADEGMYLGLDEAVPFGLVVTELVSNALKHGFPRGRTGRIGVSLRSAGGERLELFVRDDGIGLPEGFDVEHQTTFGLRMVRDLARQIQGSLNFQSSNKGTAVTFSFVNFEPAPDSA